jgi:ceramide glucosyltransferase
MTLLCFLGGLTLLSLGLNIWQRLAARGFALHQPVAAGKELPPVTLLKPLKGCDEHTAACLRSWLTQDYPAPVQVLFGIGDEADPVRPVVQALLAEFPGLDARLVVCPLSLGANPKVSTLMQLEPLIAHEAVVISDADVMAPPGYLDEAMTILHRDRVGLVNSFYRYANPHNQAMWLEAIAVNADFWSQVCQSNSLRTMKFALGAVMNLHRQTLREIGGFRVLVDYLADDNRLGLLVHRTGRRIELTRKVVDCYARPETFREMWAHQLRWARTIRACEPAPYFLSGLTHWPLWAGGFLAVTLGLAAPPPLWVPVSLLLACLLVRDHVARANWRQLTGKDLPSGWRPAVGERDLLGVFWWALAFSGNTITWHGRRYRILKGGRLEPLD